MSLIEKAKSFFAAPQLSFRSHREEWGSTKFKINAQTLKHNRPKIDILKNQRSLNRPASRETQNL